jgi:nitroreductase
MKEILNRRSIRVFEEKTVEREKIERMLRAAMQAPYAHNFQPWEFIVVKDKEKRKAIADLSIYG